MFLDARYIGNNIRSIRKNAKQSQETFAEVIETSSRTISNIENGIVIPSLQTVANIAEQFGCTVESIIKKEI